MVVAPSAMTASQTRARKSSDSFADAGQEIEVRAVAVLGRELDVGGQVARETNRLLGLLQHLLRAHAQLLLHVQGTGGDEGVDAPGVRTFQGLCGTGDVAVVGTGQRADDGVLDGVGDALDGFEITIGRCGKTGFDHVHLEALELARDAQLFLAGHGSAGRLLAIAQGGVENDELVCHGGLSGAGLLRRARRWRWRSRSPGGRGAI